MKLHILSDLHLDHSAFIPPETDADLTIFAGDLYGGPSSLEYVHKHTQITKKPSIFVAGNHEFYGRDINYLRETFNKDVKGYPNVHYLENTEKVINGVRILGATLWTNFNIFGAENREEALRMGNRALNDFVYIRNGRKTFTTLDSAELHQESVNWLQAKLAENFDGKTVVVTHHAPSFKSVHVRFKKDIVTACFTSNLEHLMGPNVALWVHGHMHNFSDFTINGTRVICNPRGYCRHGRKEHDEFVPDLVVEI